MKGAIAIVSLCLVLMACVSAQDSSQGNQTQARGGFNVQFAVVLPLTGRNARVGGRMESMVRLAIDDINKSGLISPSTFSSVSYDSEGVVEWASASIQGLKTATVLVSGFEGPVVSGIAPIVENVLSIFHHYTVASSYLVNATRFSKLTQVIPSEVEQGTALAEIVDHFGWNDHVGVICSSDARGAALLRTYLRRATELNIYPKDSEQLFSEDQYLWGQFTRLKESEARVIVSLISTSSEMYNVLRYAERLDMLSEKYVWLCNSACATVQSFVGPDGLVNENLKKKAKGMIGIEQTGGFGSNFDNFTERWRNLDPFEYQGGGNTRFGLTAPFIYDAIFSFAHTARGILNGSLPFNDKFEDGTGEVSFEGVTGMVQYRPRSKARVPQFSITNFRSWTDADLQTPWTGHDTIIEDNIRSGPDTFESFILIGRWIGSTVGQQSSFFFDHNILFPSGKEELPDLDLRNPIKYWDCEAREMKTDETGKSVRLDKPGKDAKYLDNTYRCDEYIDCYNMSDEWGCSVSFPIVFIIFGIVIFLLICFALVCIIFTVVFGYIFRRKRVRAASPFFLLMMAGATIVGYGGLYAFFGQPDTVSCNFRIWLIFLAVIVVISSLFVKSFRVWRLYRSPTEIKAIPDWQLVLFVAVTVLPVVLVLALWTGIGTPSAVVETQTDDKVHIVCRSDGITGEAGTYIFFFILVGYIGIILIFGAMLSVATRNVVSTFNESRLIAVSIYNLVFLSCSVIPIVFVLQDSGPVVIWCIEVIAIIYGFSATLGLQFIPKMYGIIVRDRLQETKLTQSAGQSTSGDGPTKSNSAAIF